MIKYLPLFIFCLFYCQVVQCQDSKMNFEHIYLEKGKSQVHVLSIFKDSKGFMWFGTYNGVFKYDGINTTHYLSNYEKTKTLSHNAVTCIFEDKDNDLWFGTEGGLNRFNRKTEEFESFLHSTTNPNSISTNNIKYITQNKDGILWIATYGGGLNRFDPKTKKFKSFIKNKNEENAISYEKINHLFFDQNYTLWLGGEACGLATFDIKSEQFKEVKILNDKPSKQLIVNSIYEDSQGLLWIGTWKDGVIKLKGEQVVKQYKHQDGINSLSSNVVLSIIEDKNGQIWFGTFSGGVDILNKKTDLFQNYKNIPENDATLSNDVVWRLFCDQSGIVWLGTFGGGVNKYDPYTSKFSLYQHTKNNPNSISNNLVSSSFQTSDGNLWIGTFGGGIDIYNPSSKKFRNLKIPKLNLFSNIRTIFEDHQHHVWIGTEGGYMRTDLNANSFDYVSSENANTQSLAYKTIYSIVEDADGNLWFGTWGNGLYIISNKEACKPKLKDINPQSLLFAEKGQLSFSTSVITCLLHDSRARIWIGSFTGFYQYNADNHKFIFFSSNENAKILSNNYAVASIFEDKSKTLWIGTFGQGLTKFDPVKPSLKYFSEEQGLSSGTISGIVQDDKGFLWISTLKGLSRLDPENMKVKNFSQSDGLQDNTFNINAFSRLSNGMLAFGGPKGINIFNPFEVINNPKIPPIAFTDLKLFNKSVKKNDESLLLKYTIDETKELVFEPNQYSFSISFTNLSFSQLENCKYAYKLDGFDLEWIYTDNENPMASYTNLSSGTYTFLLKACNSDGVWNNEGRSLKIKIIPPFWKTIWFVLLVSSILTIFTFYLFQLKMIKIVRLKNLQLKRMELNFESEKLKKEAVNINLQKELLKQEIEYKNKELASYVVGMIQKNEKLISVRDKLSSLLPILSSDIQKKMNLMIKNIEEEIGSDSNWDKFVISFNLIHDNFLKRFADQFPDMTHNDLRICAYVRMNVPNKEIADLLNVSIRTIESTRFRVRKKLDLDADTNLNDYILRY